MLYALSYALSQFVSCITKLALRHCHTWGLGRFLPKYCVGQKAAFGTYTSERVQKWQCLLNPLSH